MLTVQVPDLSKYWSTLALYKLAVVSEDIEEYSLAEFDLAHYGSGFCSKAIEVIDHGCHECKTRGNQNSNQSRLVQGIVNAQTAFQKV